MSSEDKTSTNPQSTGNQDASKVGVIPVILLLFGVIFWADTWPVPPQQPLLGKHTAPNKIGYWLQGEYSESQYRISPKEAQLLVGMNDKQVLHRIGKPSSVSFLKSNDSSIPKECASECDERWSYYDAVIHEASGTKMNLLAFMNDGKCVFVKVR